MGLDENGQTSAAIGDAWAAPQVQMEAQASGLCPHEHVQAPRPWQQDALQEALERNIILVMPTGTGKTLVAAMLIDAFAQPGTRSLFLCSSAAVVEQQVLYLARHCRSRPRVVQARDAAGPADVVVGTAESLAHHLPFLVQSPIGVLVLDEVHHAVGEHPYVRFLQWIQNAVAQGYAGPARVLGLTASWLHGSSGSTDQLGVRMHKLEKTVGATVFVPDGAPMPTAKITKVPYVEEAQVDEQYAAEWEAWISHALTSPELHPEVRSMVGKSVTKARVLLHGLGPAALLAFPAALCELASAQLLSKGAHAPDEQARKLASEAGSTMPMLRELLGAPEEWLPPTSGPISSKAQALVEVLRSFRARRGAEALILVFVEQVICTLPLAAVLMSELGEGVLPISGALTMPQSIRSVRLDAFRTGAVRILVGTAALEEGLDVPACSCVVRYDAFSNVKSHVQGAGRARADNAEIFYFENAPQVEAQRTALVDAVARGAQLEPSESLAPAHADAEAILHGTPGNGEGHSWGDETTMWDYKRNVSFRGQLCTTCRATLHITTRHYGRGRKKKERLYSVEGVYVCPSSGAS